MTAGLAVGTINLALGADKEAPKGVPPLREGTAEPAKMMNRKLADLRAELQEFEKGGKKEEMEKVRRQISEVERDMKSAMRRNVEPAERQERMRQEIAELHRSGRHEEAERLAREIEPAREHERGGGALGEDRERARHVAEAIEHLHIAGLHEMAENLERDVLRRMQTTANPMSPQRLERMEMELRALQESMRNLNRRLEEVGERLKKEGR